MNEQTLAQQLLIDEGFVPYAYQDSEGYLTIGIGRMIDKRLKGGISKDEALYLLTNDIKAVQSDLDAKLPWWRNMSENRQEALCNMCFNLGIDKLLGFSNTLKFLSLGQYDQAADGMLKSKWATQVGDRAKRLADMIRKG